MLFKTIRKDIQAVRERDPAARSLAEILLCYCGLHAIIAHRINHRLWVAGLRLLARFNSQVAKFFTGVEIHPGATIGEGFFIDHGAGTVIGETSEIGDGCTLFQGVTLGGTGKESGKRHPTICDNVTIGAHAQILGSIRVGRGAVIGAGAVVLDPVPDYATVVGHKAYIVRRNGERVYDFHHEKLPRIGAATEELMKRVERLEDELDLPAMEPEQPTCEPVEDTQLLKNPGRTDDSARNEALVDTWMQKKDRE